MSDRLTLTRALEGSGMQSAAAERIATEIYDAIHDNVATKADLQRVEERLNARLDLVEHRMMTRLGSLIAIATGILVAIKYFG
jgi:hypothetical protein